MYLFLTSCTKKDSFPPDFRIHHSIKCHVVIFTTITCLPRSQVITSPLLCAGPHCPEHLRFHVLLPRHPRDHYTPGVVDPPRSPHLHNTGLVTRASLLTLRTPPILRHNCAPMASCAITYAPPKPLYNHFCVTPILLFST